MAIENDFLPFAAGSSANVEAQAAYAADTVVTNGFQSGIANSAQVNKVLRQASIMAAMLAQFIVDHSGQPAIDNGTTAALEANLLAAINAVIAVFAANALGAGGTVYSPAFNSLATSGFDLGGASFRMMFGNYGAFFRQDGVNLYLMLTNSGSPAGAPNALRPFTINLLTGALTLDLTGAGATFGGHLQAASLTVTGSEGTASLTTSTLNVTSTATMASMSVSGSASASSLAVSGNITAASLNITGSEATASLTTINLAVSNSTSLLNLNVTGAASFGGLNASGLAVTGNAAVASLNVGGSAVIAALNVSGGASATTLTITGAAAIANAALSGTPTAPTQAAGDYSNNIATTAFVKEQAYAPLSAFGASLGASGYQYLPGGLLIQWGMAVVSNGTVANFPTTFPNACLQITGTDQGSVSAGTTGANTISVQPVNAGQFRAWGKNTAGAFVSTNMAWIAIGY